VAIGQTVAELCRFIIFSIWRPSAIFDLLCAYLNHAGRTFQVFIAVQNLAGIDVAVSTAFMFLVWRVWLENAFSRP